MASSYQPTSQLIAQSDLIVPELQKHVPRPGMDRSSSAMWMS